MHILLLLARLALARKCVTCSPKALRSLSREINAHPVKPGLFNHSAYAQCGRKALLTNPQRRQRSDPDRLTGGKEGCLGGRGRGAGTGGGRGGPPASVSLGMCILCPIPSVFVSGHSIPPGPAPGDKDLSQTPCASLSTLGLGTQQAGRDAQSRHQSHSQWSR